MFSLLSKELTFLFLFAITAAGVVPCGGPQKSSGTSSIVQIIFYFWWEYSENLKVSFTSRTYTRQHFAFGSILELKRL